MYAEVINARVHLQAQCAGCVYRSAAVGGTNNNVTSFNNVVGVEALRQ